MLESRSLHEPRLPPDPSMTLYSPAAPDTAVRAEAVAGIEAIQLEGFRHGPRFGVWWRPAQRPPRGAVLCVQPFGRERSVARHALASQAWRLAERGWAVLMPDLYGCGDSPGEPGEASLEGWRADLLRAAMIARQEHTGPNVFWGVRHGALLAADVAVALDQLVDAWIFWQAPECGADLDDASHDGGRYSPALLAGLHELPMQPPPVAESGTPPSALFVEFQDPATGPCELSPLTSTITESWLAAGYLATPRIARCAPFWLPAPASPMLPTPAWFATEEFLEGVR